MRPSAKYLLQHKFVGAPRPSLAAAALLPLIARSRDALQAMAAASDAPVAPPSSRSGPPNLVLLFDGTAPYTWHGPRPPVLVT